MDAGLVEDGAADFFYFGEGIALGAAFEIFGFWDGDGEGVGDGEVEVVATEAGIAVCGEDVEEALFLLEDGEVECSAAEVEDGEASAFAVEAEGECGCGGLGQEALDAEAGEFGGAFGGGALGVVKVGGHGDDGGVGCLAEVVGGNFEEFAKDEGGYLLWEEGLLADGDGDFFAHFALDGFDEVFAEGEGGFADEWWLVVWEGDD